MTDPVLERLTGGDRRSTGRSDEVAAEASARPELLAALVQGMSHPDELVRMRAADALEKATASRPESLQPFVGDILETASTARQQEVRWHAAQLMGRMAMSRQQRDQAVKILYSYLQDRSRIVVTFSLQALADLARQDPALMEQVLPLLEGYSKDPAGSIRSRAARLLAELSRANKPAPPGRQPVSKLE